MPRLSRKGIAILLLVALLTILMAFIPNMLSADVDLWFRERFGEGYKPYLVSLLPFCAVVLVLLTTDLGKWLTPGVKNKSADLPPDAPDPDLVAKVRKYLNEHYEHRYSQILLGRKPVNLRILPSRSGTSEEGAANYMTLQEEEVRAAIGDIFTRANDRLLLIGLPGAGKTTLVLQLALHLLERPGGSMPVVLNLATWRAEFKTFEEWLTKILPTELGASTGLAEQIRNHIPLILLLDGLDEVPDADRDSLLAGIGEYGADANRQFLISSRIAEYATTKDAPVNAQVEVAPLTVDQVEMSLSATANIQPESRRLLNALKSDPLLREAVENPFYLNTAQLLFSTGKNWSELGFVASDVAGRKRELVERFVEGALEKKVHREYPKKKSEYWLIFLAFMLTNRNFVAFELSSLQPSWLPNMIRLEIGLSIFIGLFVKAFLGSTIFLFSYLFLIQAYVDILIFGFWHGIIHAFISAALISYSFPIFIGFLGAIFSKELIDIETNFNQKINFRDFNIRIILTVLLLGIIFSVIAKTAFLLLFSIVFVIVYEVFEKLKKPQSLILQIQSPYQRFISSAKNFHPSIFQHWLLRFQMSRKDLLPLHLVDFLNELSLRHILEFDGNAETGTGGGSWRFRHRILQEYFAERWVEPEAEGQSKSSSK